MEFEFTRAAYTEEADLARQGVPVAAEANRRLRELEQPVKDFAETHLNSIPIADEVARILPALEALQGALSRAEADGVHPEQRDYAWDHLAAACARVARIGPLSCADPTGAFVRTVLLEASRQERPVPTPEADSRFDEFPSWGSPAARIEAADGVTVLASHPTCTTPEVLEAVDRLAADPAPAVRFQVARALRALRPTAPTEMWRIVERLCLEEPSRGVLQALVSETLRGLVGGAPDRVAALTRTVFDRVREGPGADGVRELCIDLFRGLYVWRDHDLCREVVWRIVADPAGNAAEVGHVLGGLREPLTHGPVEPSDPRQDAIRQRALGLVGRILEAARDALREIETGQGERPLGEWPPETLERWRAVARLADHVGTELYFASGAFGRRRQGEERTLTEADRARFYREAGWMLDELADLGLPSLAHHLVQTLETFIALDPRGVFLRLGRVVRGGRRFGYQYESMAADLIVRLVERYLAEHRASFREDEDCRRTLLEILDVFVQAGWPSARRLTYRLEVWRSRRASSGPRSASGAPSSAVPSVGTGTLRYESGEVGVRELRQNLSVYLRRVKAGASVEVKERGRRVAVLAPVGAKASVLDRLVAAGRATAATQDLLALGPPLGRRPSRRASRALARFRDERA